MEHEKEGKKKHSPRAYQERTSVEVAAILILLSNLKNTIVSTCNSSGCLSHNKKVVNEVQVMCN